MTPRDSKDNNFLFPIICYTAIFYSCTIISSRNHLNFQEISIYRIKIKYHIDVLYFSLIGKRIRIIGNRQVTRVVKIGIK